MTDPRAHPFVASADGDRIEYRCGCINAVTPPSGVLRSVAKCAAHQAARREAGELGLAYYQELGAIVGGVPQCKAHLDQLHEALGPFPVLRGIRPRALEVGCGASLYAPGLLAAGYRYLGLDPSPWAAGWTASAFGVETKVGTVEDAGLPAGGFELVLAVHCVEHTADAPATIRRLAELVCEWTGGELWVVVPDDGDPVNPDHTHHFDEGTLRYCLESAGLVVETMAVRKYVEQESFIYARARKP